MLLKALPFFFLSFWVQAKEISSAEIYYGINADFAMPMLEVTSPLRNPKIEKGIFKDLGEALAKELEIKPVWILLPKNRIGPSLLSGNISIICHTHEVWNPQIRDEIQWSHDLYRSTNVIAFMGKKKARTVKDLYGERVGVIRNFIYRSLEDAFSKNLIHRENESNVSINLQKLVHGHVDYIVMSNFEFQYFKKAYPNLSHIDLALDVTDVKCALSKSSKISLNQLNRAIDLIKNNGTLDKILRSY
jgi:polar amino acid transport system substrate-binding protein